MGWKSFVALPLFAIGLAPTVGSAQLVTTYPIHGYGYTNAEAYSNMVNDSLFMTCRGRGQAQVVPDSDTYTTHSPSGMVLVNAVGVCGDGVYDPGPDLENPRGRL